MAINKMCMKFEIEIPKQTWVTLWKPFQLQSPDTKKSNMAARRTFWKSSFHLVQGSVSISKFAKNKIITKNISSLITIYSPPQLYNPLKARATTLGSPLIWAVYKPSHPSGRLTHSIHLGWPSFHPPIWTACHATHQSFWPPAQTIPPVLTVQWKNQSSRKTKMSQVAWLTIMHIFHGTNPCQAWHKDT